MHSNIEDKYAAVVKAFQNVAKTEEGKLVFDTIRSFCQYDRPLGKEPNELMFNEGKRMVYLFIKERLEFNGRK